MTAQERGWTCAHPGLLQLRQPFQTRAAVFICGAGMTGCQISLVSVCNKDKLFALFGIGWISKKDFFLWNCLSRNAIVSINFMNCIEIWQNLFDNKNLRSFASKNKWEVCLYSQCLLWVNFPTINLVFTHSSTVAA